LREPMLVQLTGRPGSLKREAIITKSSLQLQSWGNGVLGDRQQPPREHEEGRGPHVEKRGVCTEVVSSRGE